MGVVVSFNFADWIAKFPAMAGVSDDAADGFFALAETVHANDGTGPVNNATLQTQLLYLLTAHFAQLLSPRDASGNLSSSSTSYSGQVGQVTSASEGSVSVTVQALSSNNDERAAFFNQTQYGAAYWRATGQFRTIRYRPPYGRAAFRARLGGLS